jgi:hypothetical protein
VDETTTQPAVDHTYPQSFEGTATVQLTAAGGGTAVAKAPVHVNTAGLAPRLPAAPAKVSLQSTVLRWKSSAKAGKVETWRVHDSDGRLLAQLPGSARQVRLASLPEPTATVTVEAVNAYGTSTAMTVSLPRAVVHTSASIGRVPAGAGGSVAHPVALRGAAEATIAAPEPPRSNRLFALEVAAAVLLASVVLSWLLAVRLFRLTR